MEKKHVNLSFDIDDPTQYEAYVFIQKLGRTKSQFVHILINEYLKKYSTLKADDLIVEDAKALFNFATYIYSNDPELKMFAEALVKKHNNILANKVLLSKDASLIKLFLQLPTNNKSSTVSSEQKVEEDMSTPDTHILPDAPISKEPIAVPEHVKVKEDIVPPEDKKPHINPNLLKAINSYKHS